MRVRLKNNSPALVISVFSNGEFKQERLLPKKDVYVRQKTSIYSKENFKYFLAKHNDLCQKNKKYKELVLENTRLKRLVNKNALRNIDNMFNNIIINLKS